MRPLTEDTPKPLLPVAGKPIIQHNIDLIYDEVDEIIVVGGYRIDQLREKLEDPKIKIIEQEEALGTADAALRARELIDSKTVIMNGDDIYGENAIEAMKHDSAVLASQVDEPEKFGVFKLEDGKISGLVEKPDNPPSSLANIGFYVVQPDFFDLLDDVEISERGEYEITDAINSYIQDHEVEFVKASQWLPCSYPFQLIEASKQVADGQEIDETAEVSEDAELQGNIFIGEKAEVKPGSRVSNSIVLSEASVEGDLTDSIVMGDGKVEKSDLRKVIVRGGETVSGESVKSDEVEILDGEE